MLAIQLPVEAETRLMDIAVRTGRSASDCAREAILFQLEDIEDYCLGLETLEQIYNGTQRTYSEEEVREKLGLVG